MAVRVQFAPSPTGHLHIGGVAGAGSVAGTWDGPTGNMGQSAAGMGG